MISSDVLPLKYAKQSKGFEATYDAMNQTNITDPSNDTSSLLLKPLPNVRLNSPDVARIMSTHISEPNGKTVFITGAIITSPDKNVYKILKYLSPNAALCLDQNGTVHIIKSGHKSNNNFMKEVVLNEFFSRGYYVSEKNIESNQPTDQDIDDQTIDNSEHKDLNTNDIELKLPDTSPSVSKKNRGIDCCSCLGFFCKALMRKRSCDRTDHEDESHIMTQKPSHNLIPSHSSSFSKHVVVSDDGKIVLSSNDFDRHRMPECVDTFEVDDRMYQVTRFVGIDMFSYLTKHIADKNQDQSQGLVVLGLGEKLCKKIFKQIVLIIKDLHKLGIAHGDISLENLCVDTHDMGTSTDPYVRIIDLGFSGIHHMSPIKKILNGHKQSDHFTIPEFLNSSMHTMRCTSLITDRQFGKQDYVSPERRRANYDANASYCMYKDDAYALGVILFMLFMGFSPYDSNNNLQYIESTITHTLWLNGTQKYWIRKTIPEKPLNLIKKLIQFDAQRISVNEILSHPWMRG